MVGYVLDKRKIVGDKEIRKSELLPEIEQQIAYNRISVFSAAKMQCFTANTAKKIEALTKTTPPK